MRSGTSVRRRRSVLARLVGMPTTERVDWAYAVAAAVLKPLLTLLTRRHWRGTEHIPAEGGVIVAANHVSHVDPLALADFLVYGAGRLPRFIAKIEIFRVPVIGAIMRGAQQIPVHRNEPTAALSLKDAVRALQRGLCVQVYPEGTVPRNTDLWPSRTKTGVARLALMSGVPVVPVALWGPQELYDMHGRWYQGLAIGRKTDVHITAGPPVDLSPFLGREITLELLHEVTAVIMDRITELLAELRNEEPPSASARHAS